MAAEERQLSSSTGNCFHFQETLKLGASYAFVINERNHLGLQPLHMSRLLLKRGKPGVRGQIVTDIQNALGRAGHPVPTVDGVYGQDTQTAVASFQKEQGRRLPAIEAI